MPRKKIGSIVGDEQPTDSNGDGGERGAVGGESVHADNAGVDEIIAGFDAYNPGSGSGDSGSESGSDSETGGRKRRGRRPGSKNKARSTGDLSGLEAILLSVHFGLAALTKTPEFQLAEDECSQYAAAIGRVASHYDHTFNPVVMAWLNLAAVAGTIYGTRIYAINARWKAERKDKPRPAVVPIQPAVEVTWPSGGAANQAKQPKREGPGATPADIFGLDYGGAIADNG